MYRDQILGSWQSVCYTDARGIIQPYDRQTLTFRSDGSGHMHARTLFKRNSSFSWELDGLGFYVRKLGGPGSVGVAQVEDGNLAVIENGMLMVYRKL